MLTDEKILDIQDVHVGSPTPSWPLAPSDWVHFARAIESAACAPLLERIAELETELRAAEDNGRAEILARLRDREGWDRECADTDKLLTMLGLDPVRCRTEGGSLKVPSVVNQLAQRHGISRQIIHEGDLYALKLHTARSATEAKKRKDEWVCAVESLFSAAPAAPEQQEQPPEECPTPRACSYEGACRGDCKPVAKEPNAQQAELVECGYGDGGRACCEGGPCAADVHNESVLAQQAEAQPVAEVIIGDDEFDLGLTDDYAFGKLKLPNGRHMLYTAQPKAVPLTELQRLTPEEVSAVFRKWFGEPGTNPRALILSAESALAAKNGMELVCAPAEKGGE